MLFRSADFGRVIEEMRGDVGVNSRLAELRANFTADGVRRKTKSEETFKKHQRNNERFILYLYEKKPEMLHADFRHELDDVNAAPDYSDVIARYPKYRRSVRPGKRVKVLGTLEQWKEKYWVNLLQKTISDALGQPGMSPYRLTVIFRRFL